MKLINTKWYGSYEIYTDRWGTRLRKTFNPDGVDINEDELATFELNPDFKKIPRFLFEKIVSFSRLTLSNPKLFLYNMRNTYNGMLWFLLNRTRRLL